jgi:hypothetical protein
MNKEFSNIVIFNNKDIVYIKETLEKMLKDLEYEIGDENNFSIQIDILQDNINNICIVSSEYFKFKDTSSNKSIIRKIAKRTAQDTFMVTASDNFSIIEKYSFNKRIYDYICFGNKEKLINLGYDEAYETYMYQEVWKNHFVGRNNINNVNKILNEIHTFFEYYEIILEILKLYGIKPELATYKVGDNIYNHDILKETIYIK